MTWNEIAIGIAGIIVAFGGAGGIIVAVSKWLGGIIAESIQKKQQSKYDKELERIKQEHQKEIEAYKNELQIVCENVKRGNTEAIYVTEKQFDIEISLFQELNEKAFVLQLDTKALFVDLGFLALREEQKREMIKGLYSKFINSFYEFANVLGKSRAFIDLDIYDSYVEFSDMCQLQGSIFMTKIMGEQKLSKYELKDCKARREKIEQINAATSLLIKTYLTKLKITNNNNRIS